MSGFARVGSFGSVLPTESRDGAHPKIFDTLVHLGPYTPEHFLSPLPSAGSPKMELGLAVRTSSWDWQLGVAAKPQNHTESMYVYLKYICVVNLAKWAGSGCEVILAVRLVVVSILSFGNGPGKSTRDRTVVGR